MFEEKMMNNLLLIKIDMYFINFLLTLWSKKLPMNNNYLYKTMYVKKLCFILFLIVSFSYGQESILMDFGSPDVSYPCTGNWNNITVSSDNQSGIIVNLINNLGNTTGEILTLNDSFNYYNTDGTTTPDASLPFIDSTTKDSFFGESVPFNDVTNPTGGFTLSNLDPSKYYSFSIFASRMSVSDNRETLYTATGTNSLSDTLNASNNTSNTATILNIQPLSNGTISFAATTGNNNNNAYGFYYLGAIKMVASISPITSINPTSLTLVYPNGDELWEVNKTPYISWESQNITNITLEYTTDDGSSWNTIATVPASDKKYNWTIPNSISTQCKVRISEGSNTDLSDANFSIINNDGLIYKIVVLGSSTAAGVGPIDINNAWVWRYRNFLTQIDTRYVVENLAVGGFTTYNILPTGTSIPSGIGKTIDTEKNITKALTLNPHGIIINLPSNDAAASFPTIDQITNYHLIRNTALGQGVPVWISSPQPRYFGTNTTALNIQLEMVTATTVEFGEYAFDFWNGFGIIGGNGILPEFDVDGVHMNDAGHKILYERVVAKGIHTTIKNLVDATLDIESYFNDDNLYFNVYPNPIKNKIIIDFKLDANSLIKIAIFDVNGRVISELLNTEKQAGNYSLLFQINNIEKYYYKGIYFCRILTEKGSITKKIFFN